MPKLLFSYITTILLAFFDGMHITMFHTVSCKPKIPRKKKKSFPIPEELYSILIRKSQPKMGNFSFLKLKSSNSVLHRAVIHTDQSDEYFILAHQQDKGALLLWLNT